MNNFMKPIGEKTKDVMGKTRFFSRNTTPKIVSIIFALVMWLYVMGEVNPEAIEEWKNVSVQILNVDEMRQAGLVIIGQTDFTVNVKVKGKRNDLYKISSKDMVVRADIRGFRKGVNSVPLEYSAPSNIDIEDISPKEIKVTLDEIVKKQKPVVINSVGQTAQGYEPTQAIVSPSEVMVEGPESLVNTVSAVMADVNLKDKLEDIKDRLPLRAVTSEGKEVNGVQVITKFAEVTLPIYKLKEVPIVVELQGSPLENFKITNLASTPGFVVIKGPKNVVDQISEIKTEGVMVDGIEETTTKNITLILPEGIETPYLDKNLNVNITVEEIIRKEFEYFRDEVALDNLESKYIIDLSAVPDKIKVELEAVESIMKDFKKDELQLYLNLHGLLEGKYSAKLLYNAPIKPDKITITPNKVDFEIKVDEEANSQ